VRPEVVYHLAFHVLVPKGVENPILEMDSIIGSLRLLQKAKEIGVRKVVFTSSGFLYGNARRLPATEEDPIEPVTPYVVAKYAVENYLKFYSRTYGVPYVVLRYAAIYGPRQVTGAMADYIRRLSAGMQADIWGDGSKTRDYVYIADVVEANMLALSLPAGHANPVFNIGTSIETTLNDLYGRIAGMLGVEAKPTYHPDRAGEQIRYCLDNTKAQRELGWKPRHSLEDGLRLTIRAYKGR
jgi:UDP-glucose 4-epimerase